MAYVSLLILLLLFGVGATASRASNNTISGELANGNPLAWLLLVAVCAMIFLFARRLNTNSHRIRSALLLLNVIGLLVIAFTPHDTSFHGFVLLALCLLTAIWFIVVAFDYDCPHLVLLSAICCILLPMLIECGLAESGLIGFGLYGANVLYFWYLDPKGRTRWP